MAGETKVGRSWFAPTGHALRACGWLLVGGCLQAQQSSTNLDPAPLKVRAVHGDQVTFENGAKARLAGVSLPSAAVRGRSTAEDLRIFLRDRLETVEVFVEVVDATGTDPLSTVFSTSLSTPWPRPPSTEFSPISSTRVSTPERSVGQQLPLVVLRSNPDGISVNEVALERGLALLLAPPAGPVADMLCAAARRAQRAGHAPFFDVPPIVPQVPGPAVVLVADDPAVHLSLKAVADAGVRDVDLVAGAASPAEILTLLREGRGRGLRLFLLASRTAWGTGEPIAGRLALLDVAQAGRASGVAFPPLADRGMAERFLVTAKGRFQGQLGVLAHDKDPELSADVVVRPFRPSPNTSEPSGRPQTRHTNTRYLEPDPQLGVHPVAVLVNTCPGPISIRISGPHGQEPWRLRALSAVSNR